MNITTETLSTAKTADLVAFYNMRTGRGIKKFETRAIAEARVREILNRDALPPMVKGLVVAAGAPSPAVARVAKARNSARVATERPSKGVVLAATPDGQLVRKEVRGRAPTAMDQIAATVASAPAKKSAAKKPAAPAKKPAKKPSGERAPRFTLDGRITVLVKGNPKHGTAAARYDLYRNGMTVAAYIAASGQRRDVVWDQKMGFIRVDEPGAQRG